MIHDKPSLADKFVLAMEEIKGIDRDVTNEYPDRYAIRKLRYSAEQMISDAIDNAFRAAEIAREFKRERKDAP